MTERILQYFDASWELGNEPNSLPHQLNFSLPAKQLGKVDMMMFLMIIIVVRNMVLSSAWIRAEHVHKTVERMFLDVMIKPTSGPTRTEASASRVSFVFQFTHYWSGHQWGEEVLQEKRYHLSIIPRAS